MKINDTSVTGVFNYDSSLVFEENDFVISGKTIYICLPGDGITEVQGEDPSTSSNFTIYLGNQSTSVTDYLDFLESGEGENKYLSTLVLQQVLNSYLLGPDGKGIIGDYVTYTEEDSGTGNMTVSVTGLSEGSLTTDPETIIADIMNNENINNAMLRVSRNLPEIQVYVGSPSTEDLTSTDTTSCILRQYTYYTESSGHKIRTQELIDPVSGLIFYRAADIDNGDQVTSSTDFKCSVANSEELKKKADNIFALYNSRLKVLRAVEKHLKNNFRYRKLDLPSKKPTSLSLSTKTYGEITVMVTEGNLSSGIYKNSEIAINLSDTIDTDTWPKYIIGDYRLSIVKNGENSVNISLETSSGGLVGSGVWISSVYYREYYGL